MIGRLDPRQNRITIVGAGISGLLLAYFLDRRGLEVTLLEEAPEAGGLIRTKRTPFGISESAAHSLLASEPVRALFAELGVPLVSTLSPRSPRFVLREGSLRKVPWQALRFAEWIALLVRAAFVPSRGPGGTLEAWGLRHLGAGATRAMLAPFVRGIFGAELSELEASVAFPSMVPPRGRSLFAHLLAARFSGAPRGRKSMMAPKDGMGALVKALESHLDKRLGARFARGARLGELPHDTQVALCVPAAEAARLLASRAPTLAARLSAIRYVPLVSVTSFVARTTLDRAPVGVGYLSARERHPVLGTLFNSESFPGRVISPTFVSFTTMLGGTGQPGALELQDSAIEAAIQEELRARFGPRARIDHRVIHRWPRAIPLYDAAVGALLATEPPEPGLLIFGNYTGQVSVRGLIESLTTGPDTSGSAASRL